MEWSFAYHFIMFMIMITRWILYTHIIIISLFFMIWWTSKMITICSNLISQGTVKAWIIANCTDFVIEGFLSSWILSFRRISNRHSWNPYDVFLFWDNLYRLSGGVVSTFFCWFLNFLKSYRQNLFVYQTLKSC